MSANRNESGDWLPCPPGLLSDCGTRARSRRQRRVIVRAVTASLLLVLVGVGSWTLLRGRPDGENHFGGIACTEVRANMPAFMAGTLSQDVVSRIRAHLDQCPACQKLMQNMPKMQTTRWFPASAELSPCMCEACQRGRFVAYEERTGLQPFRESLAIVAPTAGR